MVININEIFTSISGEVGGAFPQGAVATFVRFQGCNLNCPWCDTKHSIPPATDKSYHMTVEMIEQNIRSNNVVITGGEPLVQEAGLYKLIHHLLAKNYDVQVETNGTYGIDRSGYAHKDTSRVSWVIDRKMYIKTTEEEFFKRHENVVQNPKTIIKYAIENEKHLTDALFEIKHMNDQKYPCRAAISIIETKNAKTSKTYLLRQALDKIMHLGITKNTLINTQLHKLINLP